MKTYPQSFVLGFDGEIEYKLKNIPFKLCTSPDLTTSVASNGDNFVVILGDAIIPSLSVTEPNEVAKWLADGDANLGRIWRDMAKLSGRFVIIAHFEGRTFILPDATASRPIYFSARAAGSHASLVADIVGEPVNAATLEFVGSKFYRSGIWHLPGTSSAFSNVKLLPANTSLDFDHHTIRPMQLSEPTAGAAPSDVAAIISKTYGLWRDVNPIVVSLTAGVDSRITFAAALADGRPFSCFTYVKTEESKRDDAAASRLCELFGIAHQSVPVEPAPEDFRTRHKKIAAFIRNPMEADTIYSCSKSLPAGILELKSSISEIGRAFYRRRMFTAPPSLGKREMAALYKNWLPKKLREYARDAFEAFPDPSRHVGYDPLDMFYWEHRLSAWQALQLQGYDMSHRSLSLFNNRELLQLLLSLPIESRMSDRAQIAITAAIKQDVPLPSPSPASKRKKMLRTGMFLAMSSV